MTEPHEHEDQDDYCPNCGGDGYVYDCIDGMCAAGRPAPNLPSVASRRPTHALESCIAHPGTISGFSAKTKTEENEILRVQSVLDAL